MNRREFVCGALAGSAAVLVAKPSFASQQCVAMTQNGAVQRCTAGIESFKFQSAYQQAPEWCWAASISMIFAYYEHPVSQRRIVEEVWGAVVNMPGQPRQILSALNRQWTDDHGGKFTSKGDATSANPYNAVRDLEDNQPLIIGGLGHATVLTALTADTNKQTGQWQIVEAVVRDPWPRSGGRRVLSPREWASINFAARVRIS